MKKCILLSCFLLTLASQSQASQTSVLSGEQAFAKIHQLVQKGPHYGLTSSGEGCEIFYSEQETYPMRYMLRINGRPTDVVYGGLAFTSQDQVQYTLFTDTGDALDKSVFVITSPQGSAKELTIEDQAQGYRLSIRDLGSNKVASCKTANQHSGRYMVKFRKIKTSRIDEENILHVSFEHSCSEKFQKVIRHDVAINSSDTLISVGVLVLDDLAADCASNSNRVSEVEAGYVYSGRNFEIASINSPTN